MSYTRKITQAIIVITAALFPILSSHAVILQINTAQSVVHTTEFSIWNSGVPDNVDIALSGTFDLAIKSGLVNVFSGLESPNRIEFTNVNVPTSGSNARSWKFPAFEGFFDFHLAPSFYGTEDPCFAFQYLFSGSCFSAGNFGSFSGTWDGSNLVLTGTKNADFSTGENAFSYTIVATAISEPTTYTLIVFGLLLLLVHRSMANEKTRFSY